MKTAKSPWAGWSTRALTNTLERLQPGLIERLTELLPALYPGKDRDEFYRRHGLSKLLIAFLPSDAFADKDFRFQFLNLLQPEQLAACARAVGFKVDAVDTGNFQSVRDSLADAAWSGAFASAFVRHFDLPPHFLPVRRERHATVIQFRPATPDTPNEITRPYRMLKDYQAGAYWEALPRLEPACARMVLQMPTGAGKTRTAVELVADHLNRHPQPTVVVWLAHAAELCEQAMEAFTETWQHVGQRPLAACRAWGGGSPSWNAAESVFVVGSFQKMRSVLNTSGPPRPVSLVVVDEAHMTMAPTYEAVVSRLLGQQTRVLGLTATPERPSEEGTAALADFYFNNVVTIPTDGEQTPSELLTRKRVLARAEHTQLRTSIDLTLTQREQRYLEQYLDLPPSALERVGRDNVRNLELLKIVQDRCSKGAHVLLFACSVAHSKFLTSMLLYMGLKAAHIDGSTGGSQRAAITRGLKDGTLQVVCNYGVLSTGFDAPCVDVVVIARPTGSRVLLSQMIGRGLRGPVLGGTERCEVICEAASA